MGPYSPGSTPPVLWHVLLPVQSKPKVAAGGAAENEAGQAERRTGPLLLDFAEEFVRRQAWRWKPATRRSNAAALRRHLLPAFGAMRVADFARTDVEHSFWTQ